ncbi:PACE efflux transporter [Enterobacter kobei]|nr:PACE efflux transporter [Enterobacter kobei]
MEIELNKSVKERIFHAVIFEVIANVIIALSLAWLMNVSILQSGSLSVISALTATAWNFVFNKLFDSLQKKYRFQRTFLVRAMHAVGFETGLII